MKKKTDGFDIDIKRLKSSPAPVTILFHHLEPLGFSKDSIKKVGNRLTSVGRTFYAGEWAATKGRTKILVRRRNADALPERIEAFPFLVQWGNWTLSGRLVDEADTAQTSSLQVLMDYDTLELPLTIRTWNSGDRFYPVGMDGRSQTVKKFFVNQKIEVPEKKQVPILCSGDSICWIVGYRLDHQFRITEKTKRVLMVNALL